MGQLSPEWQPWLELLEAVRRALEDPAWPAAVPAPAPDRPAGSPMLHGAEFALDARLARRWVRRLIAAAAAHVWPGSARLARFRSRRLDALALMEAAVCHDLPRLEALAAEAGAEPHALGVIAQLAARPLLQACARRLAGEVPAAWPHGYCPICGDWPSLAELRGLDRARRLRCARCGGDWWFSVLHCPFCGERDHRKLGSLLPEGEEEIRKVDTCGTCKGYVKTVTTLRALPPWGVALEDLKTVELDLAALERGYSRPHRAGYDAVVRFVEPERPTPALWGRFPLPARSRPWSG